MRKEVRKQLEDLSEKAFGNKNYYRRIEKYGLTYKDPSGSGVAKLRLTEEGLIHYLEKTIKVRDDFNKGLEVLNRKETDVRTEGD
jgi:hypothetical protein